MDSSGDEQDDDADSNSDEGEQEDSDDLDAQKDIVKDFSLSSDEESE